MKTPATTHFVVLNTNLSGARPRVGTKRPFQRHTLMHSAVMEAEEWSTRALFCCSFWCP